MEACVRAIYPVVDSICAASQYDRNLVGQPIQPDGSLARLLATPDPENKLRLVVERDFRHLPGINGNRNCGMRRSRWIRRRITT